jgi:hypothetical protein
VLLEGVVVVATCCLRPPQHGFFVSEGCKKGGRFLARLDGIIPGLFAKNSDTNTVTIVTILTRDDRLVDAVVVVVVVVVGADFIVVVVVDVAIAIVPSLLVQDATESKSNTRDFITTDGSAVVDELIFCFSSSCFCCCCCCWIDVKN